jgi:hypothetical protein
LDDDFLAAFDIRRYCQAVTNAIAGTTEQERDSALFLADCAHCALLHGKGQSMKTSRLLKLSLCAGVGLLAFASLESCAKEPFDLELVGYDYTDRAILDFSVDGASGGNVFLSTKTAGGGKYACCVRLDRSTKTPFWIDVEYTREALVSYPSDQVVQPADQAPIKAYVEVKGVMPEKPAYLEIHFYPDGHIEGALSGEDGPSPPRLRLERRRPYAR